MYPGNGLLSYYLPDILALAGIGSSETKLVINTLLNVFSWFAALIGAFTLTDRWGRRPMAITATLLTVVGYILVTAMTAVSIGNPNFGATVGVIVFIFFINLSYGATWTPLQALYPTEIQAYVTRGKAVGVTQFFFALNGLIFNYANAVGLANLTWKYYIVIGGINLLWFFAVYFLFVETKGRTMEELAAVFESSNPIKASLIPVQQTEEAREDLPGEKEVKA